MSRGQRSSNNNGAVSAASGSSSNQQQQSPQQQSTPRRGNKTLGWYLGDKLNNNNNSSNLAENTNSDAMDGGDSSTSNQQQQMAPSRPSSGQTRKGSLVDTMMMMSPANSTRSSPKIVADGSVMEQHKSHLKRHVQQQQQHGNHHRPRANSSAMVGKKPVPSNTLAHSIHSGLISNSTKDLANQNQQTTTRDHGGTPQPVQRTGKGLNAKEDYWYYDENSDGFYYEHNGTRGWRKRKPEWGTVEQMKRMTESSKNMATNTQQQQQQKLFPDPKTSVPSLLAPQQLSKFMQPGIASAAELIPPPAPPAMNFRYYDPTSDGFYYEMASFDGWKRRQPTTGGEGVSPPSSLASSLGKGQQQQRPQQRQSSSPANTIGAGGPVPHRKIQPLHYQAYQQPAPQLNTIDLQEMILMAQQQQQQLRTNSNSQQQNAFCCAQSRACCPSSAPACYCSSIAAIAAQLVLQQQQLMQVQQNQQRDNLGGGLTDSKSTDNIRSLLDKKLLADSGRAPAKLFPTTEEKAEGAASKPMKLAQSQPLMNATNLKLPRNKWNPLGIVSSAKSLSEEITNITTTTTAPSTGSFEEPYEFYWSGDEAGSEAAPLPNNFNQRQNQQQLNALNERFTLSATTAASVSSIDDDGMDDLMSEIVIAEKPKIAPIGSEQAASACNNYNIKNKTTWNNNGKRRPDTLKLTCPKPTGADTNNSYEPISPGEIIFKGSTTSMLMNEGDEAVDKEGSESPAVAYLPYEFNVDKFIADLPMPSFDHERLLHSVRNPNLRTPLAQAPAHVTSAAAEPSTAETPLFTPIVLGKDPWAHYRQHAQNPWAFP